MPEPGGARNARDAFLYLLTFASLYITVSSVILLFYTYLDYLYPDPAWGDWYAEAALDTVRYAIAAIAIGFPLFWSDDRRLAAAVAAAEQVGVGLGGVPPAQPLR